MSKALKFIIDSHEFPRTYYPKYNAHYVNKINSGLLMLFVRFNSSIRSYKSCTI